jgi:hypothetical protein
LERRSEPKPPLVVEDSEPMAGLPIVQGLTVPPDSPPVLVASNSRRVMAVEQSKR